MNDDSTPPGFYVREAALGYARLGLRVVPLHTPRPDGGCSCRQVTCRRIGKHPRTLHGVDEATAEKSAVRERWAQSPHANVGIALDGLIALDVDGDEGFATLGRLAEEHGPLPTTWQQSTGRGHHYIFRLPSSAPAVRNGRILPGLDIKTGGGSYVVAAPSLHASGRRYEWHEGQAPWQSEPAEAPEWLIKYCCSERGADSQPSASTIADGTGATTAYGAKALRGECDRVRGASEGERNNTLYSGSLKIGSLIAGNEINEDEGREKLMMAAREAGLDEYEIQRTLESGLTAGKQHPRGAHLGPADPGDWDWWDDNRTRRFEAPTGDSDESQTNHDGESLVNVHVKAQGAGKPTRRRKSIPKVIREHYRSLDVDQVQLRSAARKAKHVTETFYPGAWLTFEAVLAAVATSFLSDNDKCVALILTGPSGSGKTLALDCVMPDASDEELYERFYRSDKFTEASFVSHRADLNKEQLAGVDLLPRIKDHTLITPELAPLFRGKREELLGRMAILTRVLDGDGLMIDSGAQGRRGYEGKHVFRWIGATTPLDAAVVEVMGHLGPRLLFYDVMRPEASDDDLEQVIFGEGSEQAFRSAKEAAQGYLHAIHRHCEEKVRLCEIEFDPDIRKALLACARMLVRLRAPLTDSEELDDGTEQPYRAAHALKCLAIGRALLYGRRRVTGNDIRLVRHVALSSGLSGRQRVMRALIKAGGEAPFEALAASTGYSRPTIEKYAKELKRVGLATLNEGGGRGIQTILVIEDEYRPLLLQRRRPADKLKRCGRTRKPERREG